MIQWGMQHGNVKWKYPTFTPTYNSWRAMRNRCLFDNKNNKNYKLKGIKICDRWVNSYDNFYEDMGVRPDGTTLDRIDSNGDYEPKNCRWVSWKKQANNKGINVFITHGGQTKTLSEWCDFLGFSKKEIARVYKRHSKYNAHDFAELFTRENLQNERMSRRVNLCLTCGRTETCKWRRDGKLCNTCWHFEYRRNRRNTPGALDVKQEYITIQKPK